MTLTRRGMIAGGAGLTAGLAGSDLMGFAKAWAQTQPWKPEAGAEIQLLRWRRYLQAEDDAFMKIVAAFTKATGVKMSVVSEGWDDVQPKASVAVSVGKGPDMFWGLFSLPHLFPQHTVKVDDVADYLAKKYGGWEGPSEAYGKSKGQWTSIPVAINGNYLNYRRSSVEKAGFKAFPTDTAGFLELCKAMKANGTPAGMPTGRATADANAWMHWVLWTHGGALIDETNKVIIDSPETAAALRYVKQLYEAFVPGTASWNDSTNNSAFLAGELHLTNNGISIYQTARARSKTEGGDAAAQQEAKRLGALAEDMDHAVYPVGPVGKPTELQVAFPMLAMTYTKFPNACKAFMAFLMEAEQMNDWINVSGGYLTNTLRAYDNNPVWTSDPRVTVFRDATKRALTPAGRGTMDERAAAALADFIVIDMFSNFCTSSRSEKDVMAVAARSAQRIYR